MPLKQLPITLNVTFLKISIISNITLYLTAYVLQITTHRKKVASQFAGFSPLLLCTICVKDTEKSPVLLNFWILKWDERGWECSSVQQVLALQYEAWNWIPGPMQRQAWKGLSVIPMFLRWDGRQREASQSLLASQCGKQQRARPCLSKRRWEKTWEVTLWPPHTHNTRMFGC